MGNGNLGLYQVQGAGRHCGHLFAPLSSAASSRAVGCGMAAVAPRPQRRVCRNFWNRLFPSLPISEIASWCCPVSSRIPSLNNPCLACFLRPVPRDAKVEREPAHRGGLPPSQPGSREEGSVRASCGASRVSWPFLEALGHQCTATPLAGNPHPPTFPQQRNTPFPASQ